jgi:glycosyltransferase involved in cell wall biosynthesis
MHRSGTSIAARAENLLGVSLGDEAKMMPPNPDNPEGYWEHLDIYNFQNRLMGRLRRRWDTNWPLPERWWESKSVHPFRDELAGIVAANFGGHPLWAWKEPQSCLLLPLWREIFEKAGTQLSCLFVVRSPADVAGSLLRRDGIPFDKAVETWFHYCLAAMRDAAGLPVVFMSYDRLLEAWEPELRRCAAALNLNWPENETWLREAMNAFLKPGLRHNRSSASQLDQIPGPARELHQMLTEACSLPSVCDNRFDAAIGRLSVKLQAGTVFLPDGARPPQVSVIVPVHNGARYLPECLDSILAQNFRDMEILIADDHSTDDSVKIIQRYAAIEPRIRWWQNVQNLGQAFNHNDCLLEARGEFIKFVHQDDKLLDTSAIKKLARALEDHPSASLAGSASTVIDEQSHPTDRRDYFLPGVWTGRQIILANMENIGNRIGEPTVVMFRKAHAAPGFNNVYKQWWDLELWFRLLEQGDFIYLAEPLSAFREHAAQQSHINRQSGIDQHEFWQLMETYYSRPWLQGFAAQRILVKHARSLKKRRARLDAHTLAHLAKIKALIHPSSYPLCWIERRVMHQFSKLKKMASGKNGVESRNPHTTNPLQAK